MKKLFTLLILFFTLQSCENKNNLENSFWKHCGDYPISDVIVIGTDRGAYVRNDSIYFHENDSLFGVIDTIKYYYGERRLFVRNLKGKIGEYCEK